MTGDWNATFGHRPIYTPRRFYILCAAPPFLIPHSRKAFIHNQWTEPPKELTLKFESRDEWLGIRDWGLGVTGILQHRHPERSRGIFTALSNQRVCAEGKRCPGAASYQTMNVLQ